MSAEILIVDDDPQIRSVLRIALKQAGMALAEAGDGAEGLAKARSCLLYTSPSPRDS